MSLTRCCCCLHVSQPCNEGDGGGSRLGAQEGLKPLPPLLLLLLMFLLFVLLLLLLLLLLYQLEDDC